MNNERHPVTQEILRFWKLGVRNLNKEQIYFRFIQHLLIGCDPQIEKHYIILWHRLVF